MSAGADGGVCCRAAAVDMYMSAGIDGGIEGRRSGMHRGGITGEYQTAERIGDKCDLRSAADPDISPVFHDGRRHAAGDRHGAAGIDGGAVYGSAAVDIDMSAGADGGVCCRAAADGHPAAGIDGGVVCRAAGDDHCAAGYGGGVCRAAIVEEMHPAAGIDGGVVCRTADVDDHRAAGIDGGAGGRPGVEDI